MKKLIKFLFVVVILFFIIAWISYMSAINNASDKGGQDVLFTVKSGESVDEIASKLKQAGIIDSDFYFKAYVWQEKMQAELKAGDYLFTPANSIKEIVDILIAGESQSRERSMKIIEGWIIDDINGYLVKNNFVSEGEFISLAKTAVGNWKLGISKPEFLNSAPAYVDLEGYLFPDTYRVFKDATAEDIIGRLLNNFDNKLSSELREEIKARGKSIHEIITLASIIEREVSGVEDRKIVSGILWKRLSLGMALQVDSSVNYVTGKDAPAVTLEDREIDSPYNTYKYAGLPPGPICNPGLSAIEAAIYPTESPYLYYLNRQDTGETIFSKTHEEHVSAKNKYLK